MKKLSILVLSLLLIAALALSLTACDNNQTEDPNGPGNEQPPADNPCEINGHEWEVDFKKNPSCYREGSATYVCEVCGDEKTEVLPMTAHKIQKISAKAPTCTTPGRTSGERCKNAGCKYTSGGEEIPILDHVPVITPASEPTCVNKGYTQGMHCSACLSMLTAEDINAEKYPEFAAMEPSVELDALGHNFVDCEYVAPTCAAEGYEGGTRCSRCDQIGLPPTKTYDKLTTHPEYVVISVSDCMNDGYSRCPICGDEKVSSYKDSDKHIWVVDVPAVAPNCLTKTNGKTAIYKCSVAGCDTIIDATSISWELAHDESSEYCAIVWDEDKSIAATTEHAGEKHGTCSVCNMNIRIDIPVINGDSDFNHDNNIYPDDIVGTPVENVGKDDEDEEAVE